MPASGGKGRLRPKGNQWSESLYSQKEEATRRNSTVSSDSHLQTVISGLTSVVSVVLSTVRLQFQGPLVHISWRPVLGIVTVYVLGIVWSSVVNFFTLVF